MTDIFEGDFSIKGTVYNVLDSDSAININEERARYADTASGLELNPDYGMVTDRQEERFFSVVARYEF
jgi:hypothetical protein